MSHKLEYPPFCPVCGEKSNDAWVYLCFPCWHIYIKWHKKKYPNKRVSSDHLPEYLAQLKEVVAFT